MSHFKYTIILFLLLAIFSPVNTQAIVCPPGDTPSPDSTYCIPGYTLLAPLPCDNSAPGCVNGELVKFPVAEQKSQLGLYLNVMIRIVIGLAAVMAVIVIILGGLEYMTSELAHGKSHAKERITGAVFGLLIALGSYALLYTINPEILKTDLDSLKNATVQVVIEAEDAPQTPSSGGVYEGGYRSGQDWAQVSAAQPSALPYGVTSHPGECIKIGDRGCTSLRGLNMSLVQLTQFGCKCPLVITGGTESWLHSRGTSHKPGSGTVDLRMTNELSKYILSNGTKSKDSRGFTIYIINGRRYLPEHGGGGSTGDHWHVY